MTYSINTSKYTAKKAVEINGKLFTVRPTTTDEQFAITEIQQAVEKLLADKSPISEVKKSYHKIMDIYYDLFSPKDEIRKVLADIPADKLADIYQDIMENATNVTED